MSHSSRRGARIRALRPVYGRVLLTASLVAITGSAFPANDHPAIPYSVLRPPVEPIVKPFTSAMDPKEDYDRDGLSDGLNEKVAIFETALAAANLDPKAAPPVEEFADVMLVFSKQITQSQIDNFLSLGGEITYLYRAVSYGWNGRIPVGQLRALQAALGPELLAIEENAPIGWNIYNATRNGRVRPYIWDAPGSGGLGYDGDPSITIAVLDSGVDDSHTDLAGRAEYWKDFTTDLEPTPRSVGQHGTHVTGIATGTGAASGANPHSFSLSASGAFPASGTFLGMFDLPGAPATFDWASSMTWNTNGTSNAAHGKAAADTGGTTLIGVSTIFAGTGSPINANSTALANPFGGSNGLYTSYNANNGSGASNATGLLYKTSETLTAGGAANFGVGDNYNLCRGVAPGCRWAGGKVFTNAGTGNINDTTSALDDMVNQRIAHNIKVINMSLGLSGGGGLVNTGVKNSTNNAVENGIVVCVAAGNGGPTGVNAEINDPGRAANAITVAAGNWNNQLTTYTSIWTDAVPGAGEDFKPDVIAPGGSLTLTAPGVVSVDSNDSEADTLGFADLIPNNYLIESGTSMASPFTAGASALIIDAWQQAGHTWDFSGHNDAFTVKMLMCASATESNQIRESNSSNPSLERAANNASGVPTGTNKDNFEGYGNINPDAAIEALTIPFVSPASAVFAGPKFGRRAMGRSVNLTTGIPATLNLAADATVDFDLYLYDSVPGPNGRPVILASSTNVGANVAESINYNPVATRKGYVVVKRVTVAGSGTGTLTGAVPTPSPTPTPTPSPTPSNTPSFTPSNTPSPTPSNTPSPTPSNTPSFTPSNTPSPTPSNTPSFTPSNTPSPTPSNTPSPTPSNTPSNTPSPTPSNTPSPTPSNTPSFTPSNTPSPTPSNTPSFTPSNTPSPTPSDTPSPTPSPTPSATPLPPCLSASIVLSGLNEVPPNVSPANGIANLVLDTTTDMLSYNITFGGLVAPEVAAHFHAPAPPGTNAPVVFPLALGSPKIGVWGPLNPTQKTNLLNGLTYINIHSSVFPGGEIRGQVILNPCTPTPTPSDTPTATPSATPSDTPSPTPSNTPSPTPSNTPSFTPSNTPSPTPSNTPSFTPSATPSNTPSATPSNTPSFTPSNTPSPTPSNTPSNTPSPTPSNTPSPTPTAPPSPTPSLTPTPTPNCNPVVSGCPGNINLNNSPGTCGAVATWTAPTAVAAGCGASPVGESHNHNPGETFPVGDTTVTYTFTDDDDNQSVCTFHVIVTDNEPPVVTCPPANWTVRCNQPNGFDLVPVFTENCPGATVLLTPPSPYPYGDTSGVTLTVIDASGNPSATCMFDLHVTGDIQDPKRAASAAALDGSVLESHIASGVGGTIASAGTTIAIGDDTAGRQTKGIFSFDLSSSPIPPTSVITRAYLRLTRRSSSGTTGPLGALRADLANPSFGAAALAATDFEATGAGIFANVATFSPLPLTDGSSTYAEIDPTYFSRLNRSGTTQFRVAFATATATPATADNIVFATGETSNTQPERPVLVIEYFNATCSECAGPGTGTVPNSVTLFSNAAHDGYMQESHETSSVGASANTTSGYFTVGDAGDRTQMIGLLSFDTSSIPAGAVIDSAQLVLTSQGVLSAPATLGPLVADMRCVGIFGALPQAEASDFEAFATLPNVGTFSPMPTSSIHVTTANLSATARDAIRKGAGGLTQFKVRLTQDDNNNSIADYIVFYAGEASGTTRPRLIVNYRN